MVDIGKKKDKDKTEKKETKEKESEDNGGSSSSSKRKSSGTPDTFTMSDEMTSTPSGGSVADTAKEWSSDHGELNYDAGAGGGLKQYKKQQAQECKEFYENFYEMASDNMVDINQFTLYFQALTMNMARNRVGIQNVLEQEFNMSQDEAIKHTEQIVEAGGESKYITQVLNDLSLALQDDAEVIG